MFFAAIWDRKLKVMTYGAITFLLVETIGITIALLLTNTQKTAFLVGAMLCLMNMLIIGFTYSYAPRGYLVDESGITVIRKASPLHIDRQTIHQVVRIEKDRFMKSTRIFGNGGLFGYYGSFRNKTLGNFKMFSTHVGNGVLIQADGAYVVTPERPDEFVEVVKSYLPRN